VCEVDDSFETRTACASVCGGHGYDCTSARWFYYDAGDSYAGFDAACADTPPASHPSYPGSTWGGMHCRCVHTDGAATCAAGAENTAAACDDGCSNDGDGYVDCDDFDCCSVVTCAPGTACSP
jgi:hypothetical protein